MTRQEAIDRLNQMGSGGDNELLHTEADDILLDFLRALHYDDVADAYEDASSRVEFWYA